MGNCKGSRSAWKKEDLIEENTPFDVHQHISIKVDPKTGQFVGMPLEWTEYNLEINYDRRRTVTTKNFPKAVRACKLPLSVQELIQRCQHDKIDRPQYTSQRINEEWSEIIEENQRTCDIDHPSYEDFRDLIAYIQQSDNPVYEKQSSNEINALAAEVELLKEDPSNHYEFMMQIGKGATCKVYKCLHKPSGQYRAIRGFKLMRPEQIDKIKMEIALMNLSKNPNIVRYHEAYIYMEVVFMAIDYMDGGSLASFIFTQFDQLSERIISYICEQILLGLFFIHRRNQIHRDLKSDNILLSLTGEVKIADFGLATQLTQENGFRKSQVGTTSWMAPELILQKNYTQKVDIWSMGIICVELAEKEPPFLRDNPAKAMYYITKKQPYRLNMQKHSSNICQFVELCLQTEESKRPAVQDLLNHPFISEYSQHREETREMVASLLKKQNSNYLDMIIHNLPTQVN